jgi:hypothetical protein
MEADRILPPDWLLINGEISIPQFKELFADQEVLFSYGSVVWGTIVQANSQLFSPGPYDHPAIVVYSLDERIDSKPKLIEKVARHLFSLKGNQTDQDLQEFSDRLKSERAYKWKIPIPPRISNNIQCFYTTALIVRKHLPAGYLFNFTLTILVRKVS